MTGELIIAIFITAPTFGTITFFLIKAFFTLMETPMTELQAKTIALLEPLSKMPKGPWEWRSGDLCHRDGDTWELVFDADDEVVVQAALDAIASVPDLMQHVQDLSAEVERLKEAT